MNDEDGFEDELIEETMPSRRFRRADIAVVALGLVHEIVAAFHESTMTAYNLAAMHANFEVERDAFHTEAALEIETITGETDG